MVKRMQQPLIKLKEIIWEITGECKNGCRYCGSKNVWNIKTDEDKILSIAREICEFPPEVIDISGGDPLLVSHEAHNNITTLFRNKNIKPHILFNPKSLIKEKRKTLN